MRDLLQSWWPTFPTLTSRCVHHSLDKILLSMKDTFLLLFLVMSPALGSPKTRINTDCLGHDGSYLEAPVAEHVAKSIKEGEKEFAVKLIKSLFDDQEEQEEQHSNIFISPSSIFQTLSLAYFGATSHLEQELITTLGLSNVSRADFTKHYLYERAYQAIRERDPDLGYELLHANKFYFDRSLHLDLCLQLVLRDELEALDFTNDPEKARQSMNTWVSQRTRSKINELIPSGRIDSSTTVALVNAAYFKGQWASKFDASNTHSDNFYLRRDSIRIVDFMEQKGRFNYYTSEELRAHVLELPYVNEQLSMLIILPPFEPDAIVETVKRMNGQSLRAVISEVSSGFYGVDDLKVKLPRFKVDKELRLEETLAKLGVQTLFNDEKGLQNFLDKDTTEEETTAIMLNAGIHKSFVEVNEEGSEAAAATAIFGFRSARPLFHTEFVADHPFVFVIYDKKADVILFFGVLQDPSNNQE